MSGGAIWLISGGSGGHVFPAISFYKMIASSSLGKPYLIVEDIPFIREVFAAFSIEDGVLLPQVPSIKKNIGEFFRKGIEAFGIGKELLGRLGHPKAVILFGAPSSPWLILPFLFDKRTNLYVQEQNVIMGDINGALCGFAKGIFFGFTDREFSARVRRKTVFSSNMPYNIYTGIKADLPSLWRDGNRFRLLVMGGSQGARAINDAILGMAGELRDEVAIVHITGRKDWRRIRDGYAFIGVDAEVFDSVFPAYSLIEAADLVVARAGAMTLTDIARAGKAAVLVPYPFARGHQYRNSQFFEEKGAVVVISQEDNFWQNHLKSTILGLVGKESRRRELEYNIKGVNRWPEQEKLLELIFED